MGRSSPFWGRRQRFVGIRSESVQGVMFDAMKGYVVASLGPPAWAQMLEKVGRSPTFEYLLEEAYPDGELAMFAGQAAQLSGKQVTDVLEAYGEALLPAMFDYYGFLADPRWSYVDFLLNMEPALPLGFAPAHSRRAADQDPCHPHRA